MKPISQYSVTFPYGATTKPYSPSNPHTGDDRAAPKNTPIDVGDTIIGLVGTTGKSTGYHLHIQKWKGGYQNPNGQGVGNTIAFPARVTEVGYRDDIGYFVRLVDANGVRWSYFHMIKDSQRVRVGQIINKGEEDVFTQKDYDIMKPMFTAFGVKPPPDGLVVGASVSNALGQLIATPEWKICVAKARVDKKNLDTLNQCVFGSYPKPPDGVALGTIWGDAINQIPYLPEYKQLPPRGGSKYKPYSGKPLFVEDK